jgi:hypothetical protein
VEGKMKKPLKFLMLLASMLIESHRRFAYRNSLPYHSHDLDVSGSNPGPAPKNPDKALRDTSEAGIWAEEW